MKYFLGLISLYFFIPLRTLANVSGPGGGAGGASFPIKISNPLRVGTVEELLELVLNIIIQLGIPIIVLVIMWSGFLFIKAQGNEGELKKAKENIKYVLIGTAIVLGVFSILSIIQATIRAIGV